MKLRQIIILGLLAGFLAGCSQPTIPDPDADSEMAGSSDDGMSEQEGMTDDNMGGGEFFEDDAPLTMIIYFDFDESELRAEYADLLSRHAAELSNNSRAAVRLEGHADEQGTTAYNIALGERRASAVLNYLISRGVAPSRLRTIS